VTSRRAVIAGALVAAFAGGRAAGAQVVYPAVTPRPLVFPRDHGSHPDFRTEWWYVTGWLRDETAPANAAERDLGVQVTFFRHRPGVAEDSGSRFAPRQLLFAHAAIADPAPGRLRHDQRVAREGFGLAQASEGDTDVVIGDWSLRRRGETYSAQIVARDFAFALAFEPRAPLLLQGDAGRSRKGLDPGQASYYYSRPQLAASGTVTLDGRARQVAGRAWLDHEWASEFLAPAARGWDWTGLNFDDGAALMAFVIRDEAGGATWAGGAWRDAAGRVTTFGRDEVRFVPQREWRSPRTAIVYPVAMRVTAGALGVDLVPLFADQELDSRASVGAIYWEGAVRALRDGEEVGRGYLELTGYGGRLRI